MLQKKRGKIRKVDNLLNRLSTRLQSMASQLEAKLQSTELQLATIQSEYSDVIQTHLNNTMVTTVLVWLL